MMSDIFKEFDATPLQAWKQQVQTELKGESYADVLCEDTAEGFQIKPMYTKEDVKSSAFVSTENLWKIVSDFNPDEMLPYGSLDGIVVTPENASAFYPTPKELIILNAPPITENIRPLNQNTYLNQDIIGNLAFYGNWANKSKKESLQYIEEKLSEDFIKSIGVDIAKFQNAGANHVEQIALFLSVSNEYATLFGGKVLEKVMVNTAVGYNFFFEIAKLRALRVVWENLAHAYQVKTPLFIYAQSTVRNKSILDRYNNIIRTTFEATASILGNADAVHLHPYDSLLKNNKANNQELSFKQQWVLREESFLNQYTDPLKGAYFVEYLTRQLAEKAWDLFKQWEKKGGYLACLQENIIQNKIEDSAQKEQARFDAGEIIEIGVNKYPNTLDEILLPEIEEPTPITGKTLFKIIKTKRWAEKKEQENAKSGAE